MHTLLLNGPTGHESINSLCTIMTYASVLYHIEKFNAAHPVGETIDNTYELPILERMV